MFLHISDLTTIEEVQQRFRERFPFLDIAFYAEGHNGRGMADNRYRYCGQERIGNIRPYYKRGAVEIKSCHSVPVVERNLKELYGLNAQIFCLGREGDALPISRSKELSLQQQNELLARRQCHAVQFAEA